LSKKKVTPVRVPTKHQAAKWQRQNRIRRIIITASIVFMVGIISYVIYEYYAAQIKPFNEKVITVNNVSFDMKYYVNMLDAQTKLQGVEPNSTYNYTYAVAQYIEDAELMKQGAKELNITVSENEIQEFVANQSFPNDEVHRDIAETQLLSENISAYFDSQLQGKMLQANMQVMFVESEQVANAVLGRISSGGNFTELVREFSYDNVTKKYDGNLGWLPEELIPQTIAETFNLTPGEISQPIYDNSTSKDIGYWLIKVNEEDPANGINVSAMLLGSEQEALEIKGELDAGSNFSELAKSYSQHSSKYKGGELGWLKEEGKGTNGFSDAFNGVAFQLSTGQVSEPVKDETVQTKGGYWIVKVWDKQQRELDTNTRGVVKNKHFSEWLQLQRGNSTIENKLDSTRMTWAANEVIKRR
jgi:hypothetical protein